MERERGFPFSNICSLLALVTVLRGGYRDAATDEAECEMIHRSASAAFLVVSNAAFFVRKIEKKLKNFERSWQHRVESELSAQPPEPTHGF